MTIRLRFQYTIFKAQVYRIEVSPLDLAAHQDWRNMVMSRHDWAFASGILAFKQEGRDGIIEAS